MISVRRSPAWLALMGAGYYEEARAWRDFGSMWASNYPGMGALTVSSSFGGDLLRRRLSTGPEDDDPVKCAGRHSHAHQPARPLGAVVVVPGAPHSRRR
ncbi:hypothetical protein SAMN05216330_12244 [Bradyrhizobium sp. Ghvi]|nr:hypothetical protein SAMN05216330_12244 [Bradyrhizobium sp. Ghvi]